MADPYKEYWEECIAQSADECGLELTPDQLAYMADAIQGGHENYGMAFYSPPASDRLNDIEREWEAKVEALSKEYAAYRGGAEAAIKKALNRYSDANVGISSNGEVHEYGGRITRIL